MTDKEEQERLRNLPFVFTSEHALRRSIHRKYPDADPDILDATFDSIKGYVGWRKDKNNDWISPSGLVNDKSEMDNGQ